jgi:hypothetical protein
MTLKAYEGLETIMDLDFFARFKYKVCVCNPIPKPRSPPRSCDLSESIYTAELPPCG